MPEAEDLYWELGKNLKYANSLKGFKVATGNKEVMHFIRSKIPLPPLSNITGF